MLSDTDVIKQLKAISFLAFLSSFHTTTKHNTQSDMHRCVHKSFKLKPAKYVTISQIIASTCGKLCVP